MDILRNELTAERAHSESLYRENKVLREKLARSVEMIRSSYVTLDRGSNLSADKRELISLREEVKHLRDLVLLSDEPYNDDAASSLKGAELSRSDSLPSNPVTPPRSPQSMRADNSKAATSIDSQPSSAVTQEAGLSFDTDYANDIMDVGPPMSPKGQPQIPKREISADETEADRIDSEEIRLSFKEVENDLADPQIQ